MRLHQVISELIQNSIRNTRDGGEITLGARQENDFLIMWVKDNGIGIPEEEQGKIFDSFYEVADVKQHTSSNSRFGGGGIGIGLSLVKRVVETHGGALRLDSAPGRGTCVEVWLPYKFQPVVTDFQDKLSEEPS
jgi:signal transduction histidine kinase